MAGQVFPPRRVALALGSGGARGYAHIGVIKELSDRGYEIVGIAGSSMGALVGGIQAAGALDDFAAWAKTLTQRAVFRLLDPSIAAAGVLRAEKILDAVREMLGDVTIEELPIPYTAVATDLISGKSVWLQRGPVDAAIRASIAIPGVILPHVYDGRLLADGGILDPLPMAPIAAMSADLSIGVSLAGADQEADVDRSADTEPGAAAELINRLARSTSALLDSNAARSILDTPTAKSLLNLFATDDPLGDESRDPTIPKLGSFAVMNRTIEIAQAALARHQMAAYPPDLLIEIPRTACRSLEFHRAAEIIDLGQELAARALDAHANAGATRAAVGAPVTLHPDHVAPEPAGHTENQPTR